MDRPLKYRDLRRILAHFGVLEDKSRGKGSHRMFVGVVGGVLRKFPTACHAEGDTKPASVVRAFRRAFNLTADHGVSDQDFYG